MDTLVFDVETSNFFSAPGVGWNNFDALNISAVGIYSYLQDKYFCFGESELPAAAEMFRNAERLVGFSINRYDIPALSSSFLRLAPPAPVDFMSKERIDLLDEIELRIGHRISLDKLAQANLGEGKTSDGEAAIRLYREGKLEELRAYCLKDVELTKQLYDWYRAKKFFWIPNRETGATEKIQFSRMVGLFN